MKQINFSKKLMRKYGSLVLSIFEKRTLHKTPFYYRIDWNNEQSIKLSEWLFKGKESNSKELLDLSKNLEGRNCDETVINVLHWCVTNVKYVSDSNKWGVIEKWQTPLETFTSLSGDCEDGAVLMYVLMVFGGVSINQLRINLGDVVGGGHAWIEYRSDSNGKSYYIDWCYDVSLESIESRTSREFLEKYRNIWFGFNEFNYFNSYINA